MDPMQYVASRIGVMESRIDEIAVNQGVLLAGLNEGKTSRCLNDYEFQVFSQWGEDGIIQRLVAKLDIPNRTFIEFGIEDFSESNCRFLMIKDNWSGFVIDGSAENIASLRRRSDFWRHDLVAVNAFITRENINALLRSSEFGEDVGILSIDIDGNDYYILDAVTAIRPRIIICEYNAVFGPNRNITVPYDPFFNRTAAHYSNIYFGASLGAMHFLAKRKGYTLVGTSSAGANAFFVRSDLLVAEIPEVSVRDAFHPSRFRESRGRDGSLTFASGTAREHLIAGLPVLNVETESLEAF